MTVTTNIPTDCIEIVDRPLSELQYRVSIASVDVAGFQDFVDACIYANNELGVTPVGSPRSGWAKAVERDNGGCEFWTFEA
jgi:hypothetical protein